MSPHADLARSPVGLADKVWLEAVGREPGENSPWYRGFFRPMPGAPVAMNQDPNPLVR
jgi:hypothetical protein